MDQLAKNVNFTISNDTNKEIHRKYYKAIFAGFSVLFFSSFGDKIFFLNMIYASMNNFCQSFWIILAVSELMNFLNLSLGQLIKLIMPIITLECIAIFVFLILGICLIFRGCLMKERPIIIDYNEQQKKLINNSNNNIDNIDMNSNDNNLRKVIVQENGNVEEEIGVFDSWWKYFLAYFLASIGDKSSLATIIIGSKYNFLGLLTGTTLAILFLVLLAMIFGKSLSKLLTNKQISIICGIMFIVYAGYFFVNKKMLNYFF